MSIREHRTQNSIKNVHYSSFFKKKYLKIKALKQFHIEMNMVL